MDGAAASCYHQHASRVLLQQPGAERGGLIGHRIAVETGHHGGFFSNR